MRCTWCTRAATWVLVADADMQHHDHAACDEHRRAWSHLYRRAVAVSPDLEIDVRDTETDGADETDGAGEVDLRTADEPTRRHEG